MVTETTRFQQHYFPFACLSDAEKQGMRCFELTEELPPSLLRDVPTWLAFVPRDNDWSLILIVGERVRNGFSWADDVEIRATISDVFDHMFEMPRSIQFLLKLYGLSQESFASIVRDIYTNHLNPKLSS